MTFIYKIKSVGQVPTDGGRFHIKEGLLRL